jgi:hypothetical protein
MLTGVLVGGGGSMKEIRVREYGLADFIYLYEIEQ